MCSQVFPRNTTVYNRRHEVWNLQIIQNFRLMFWHHFSRVFVGCFRSLDSTSAAELFSGGPTRSCSPGQGQNVVKDGKGRFLGIYKISNITKPTWRVLLHSVELKAQGATTVSLRQMFATGALYMDRYLVIPNLELGGGSHKWGVLKRIHWLTRE